MKSTNIGSFPVAVIIHGGFWREQYTLDNSLIDSLPVFFINEGFAVYMVEYRRVGPQSQGGWPETNEDILTALQQIPRLSQSFPLQTNNVLILGHSAGTISVTVS